ncbi:manganese efflux pump MntP family protein [Idiomarina sp. 29L]|nr:manganese efflux pump MntP family protein [Idiomarina sp. 29L]RXS41938.1 manganese efflux pump MntP family protein [Idiomarina sp. 29L]
MTVIALILLAFAMSTDAFAAAIGKGAALRKPTLKQAAKIGVLFGVIEGSTPLIGWLIGYSAKSYVQAWDHWLAFGLLTILGLHMIYEGVKTEEDDADFTPNNGSFLKLVVTAIGTSIDALTVGITLAFIEVNIWLAAGLIGLATAIMVTIGVLLGRIVGGWLGQRTEICGGVVLITIGIWVLYSHL